MLIGFARIRSVCESVQIANRQPRVKVQRRSIEDEPIWRALPALTAKAVGRWAARPACPQSALPWVGLMKGTETRPTYKVSSFHSTPNQRYENSRYDLRHLPFFNLTQNLAEEVPSEFNTKTFRFPGIQGFQGFQGFPDFQDFRGFRDSPPFLKHFCVTFFFFFKLLKISTSPNFQ